MVKRGASWKRNGFNEIWKLIRLSIFLNILVFWISRSIAWYKLLYHKKYRSSVSCSISSSILNSNIATVWSLSCIYSNSSLIDVTKTFIILSKKELRLPSDTESNVLLHFMMSPIDTPRSIFTESPKSPHQGKYIWTTADEGKTFKANKLLG